MTAPNPNRVEDVVHALEQLARARTSTDVAKVIEHNPDLLTDEVATVLAELIAAQERQDPQSARLFGSVANTLRRARASRQEVAGTQGFADRDRLQAAVARAEARYRHWLKTGEDSDLNGAVEEWERVLQVARPIATPEERGVFESVMAQLLVTRHDRMGRHDDLDYAAELAHTALTHLPSGTSGHSAAANTLGVVHQRRYYRTGDRMDLNWSVRAFEEAAEGTPADAPERLDFTSNLGSALLTRAAREDNLSDGEQAVACFRAVIHETPRNSAQLPQRVANLAGALVTMHQLTGALEHLDEAIDTFQAATTMAPPGSSTSVTALVSLGEALRRRYEAIGEPATLERAIAALDRAVAEAGELRPDPALPLIALGSAVIERYRLTGRGGDFDRGMQLLQEAVSKSAPGSPAADSSRRALATAWARVYEANQDKDARARANHAYRAATASMSDPAGRLRVAEEWARWAADTGAWEDAADAYGAALDAWEQAVGRGDASQALFPSGAVASLPARAAYALAASGAPEAAVLAVERGRRLQAASHLRTALDPAAPSRDEVSEAAEGTLLTYLLATEHGGLGLVVSGATSAAVQTIRLPALTEALLRRALIPYLSTADRQRTLDDLTGWLWTTVMGPLLDAVMPSKRLTLIPLGLLSLVPLHAAWRHDEAAATGRRYALDEVTVTYTPSARALSDARRRARGMVADSILAVAPGSASELLPGAERESESVARFFSHSTVLHGEAATRRAVLHALDRHAVVHFACHGKSDLEDPQSSALLMAGEELLRPADVLHARLDSTRLVVLSASNTGLTGAEPAEDMLGWPTSFLATGAAGVIASLWEVGDMASTLLMARFYDLWRRQGRDAADALCEAQRWLRDTTNDEKLTLMSESDSMLSRRLPAAARRLWEAGRSDAHPTRWAGFAYFGA